MILLGSPFWRSPPHATQIGRAGILERFTLVATIARVVPRRADTFFPLFRQVVEKPRLEVQRLNAGAWHLVETLFRSTPWAGEAPDIGGRPNRWLETEHQAMIAGRSG